MSDNSYVLPSNGWENREAMKNIFPTEAQHKWITSAWSGELSPGEVLLALEARVEPEEEWVAIVAFTVIQGHLLFGD